MTALCFQSLGCFAAWLAMVGLPVQPGYLLVDRQERPAGRVDLLPRGGYRILVPTPGAEPGDCREASRGSSYQGYTEALRTLGLHGVAWGGQIAQALCKESAGQL